MAETSPIDQIAERVERLLLRHEELQRTNALLLQQVQSLQAERDLMKSRLQAARSRIDALLERRRPHQPRGGTLGLRWRCGRRAPGRPDPPPRPSLGPRRSAALRLFRSTASRTLQRRPTIHTVCGARWALYFLEPMLIEHGLGTSPEPPVQDDGPAAFADTSFDTPPCAAIAASPSPAGGGTSPLGRLSRTLGLPGWGHARRIHAGA